jgi:hypothetical protein
VLAEPRGGALRRESSLHLNFKQAILESDGHDTLLSEIPDIAAGLVWPGAMSRSRRNRFIERWAGREWALRHGRAEAKAALQAARKNGDVDEAVLSMGQDAGLIHDIAPAAEIVTRIAEEAERILSNGGERCGNAGTRYRQARLREASASEPSMKCRKRIRRCQNRELTLPPGSARGNPEVCPSGIRHVDGAKLNQALVWNVRTCRSDAKGEVSSGQNREAALFSRGHGPTEANWQQEEPVDEGKPFDIPKREGEGQPGSGWSRGGLISSSAGRAANLSGCVARPKERATGLIGFAAQIRRSSLIGSCAMDAAEHREPCESRGSCTDLGAPGGEIPPGDSTLSRPRVLLLAVCRRPILMMPQGQRPHPRGPDRPSPRGAGLHAIRTLRKRRRF